MSNHSRIGLALVLWGAFALAAASAEAKQVKYVGGHPMPAELGGGYCYIEFPHVHVYTPAEPEVLYRVHADGYVFVGDPVAHGYDGPKNAYYGPHPIPMGVAVIDDDSPGGDDAYCYIEGPHYHVYAAPPTLKFVVRDGVSFYTGDFPQVFVQDRPRFARINVIYRPMKYARPVVVVAPPPEFHPPSVEVDGPGEVMVPAVPGVVVQGGVGVAAPGVHAGFGVQVNVPLPSIEVHVPGVVVVPVGIEVDGHHHHDNGHHKGHR